MEGAVAAGEERPKQEEGAAPAPPHSDPRVCRHWQRKGACRLGDACKFQHPAEVLEKQRQEEERRKGEGVLLNERMAKQNRGQGRRNQVRNSTKASDFRAFLLRTFSRDLLCRGSGVLDVAGGKGVLSFELINLNGVESTVVDPRHHSLERTIKVLEQGIYHTNSHLAPLSDRWPRGDAVRGPRLLRMLFFPEVATRLGEGADDCAYFQSAFDDAANLLWTHKGLTPKEDVQANPEYFASHVRESELRDEGADGAAARCARESRWRLVDDCVQAQRIVRDCSIVVGLHPDQATGAIVDFAIARRLPFAVVPCCVYSRQFAKRKLKSGKQVTSYDDLVQFLVEKDPDNIHVQTLPFEGKNKVVFRLPLSPG